MRAHVLLAAAIAAGAVGTFAAVPSASAANIEPGFYTLSNHPDGSQRPPLYGLRLDELYNVTSGHDVFTFDFNHEDSSVQLIYDGSTIRIVGESFGGRDTGTAYANDQYRGIYSFDFTYSIGVMGVPGDDDVWVNGPNNANIGFIVTPLGDTIRLEDERGNHGYSFRLGDENNDLGHRGHDGISGWGWLNHGPEGSAHVYASDWLFTATFSQLIPAPGTIVLSAMGGLLVAGRRRKA